MRTRSHKALVRLLLSVTAIAGLLGIIIPALMMRLQPSAGNQAMPATMVSTPPRYVSFGTFQTLRNASDMFEPDVTPPPSESSAADLSLCFDGVAWRLNTQDCDRSQDQPIQQPGN